MLVLYFIFLFYYSDMYIFYISNKYKNTQPSIGLIRHFETTGKNKML